MRILLNGIEYRPFTRSGERGPQFTLATAYMGRNGAQLSNPAMASAERSSRATPGQAGV